MSFSEKIKIRIWQYKHNVFALWSWYRVVSNQLLIISLEIKVAIRTILFEKWVNSVCIWYLSLYLKTWNQGDMKLRRIGRDRLNFLSPCFSVALISWVLISCRLDFMSPWFRVSQISSVGIVRTCLILLDGPQRFPKS